MKKPFILLLVLFPMIAAAQSDSKPCWEEGMPEPSTECAKELKTACEKQGGIFGGVIQGRGRIPGCNPKTNDGGKQCSKPDQCEGYCVSGKCTEHKLYKGCGIATAEGEVCEE